MLVLRNNNKIARFSARWERYIYKVMFLNTLGIIERIMQTARDKLKNGYTEEEKRGKMESRTYPEAVL